MIDPHFQRGNYLGFRTKRELQQHISANILNAYDLGEELRGADLDLLVALLERHPRAMEKIGCGIRAIRVDRGPFACTRGFRVVRIDNEVIDFSYLKCLHPQKPEAPALNALRYVVRKQVNDYKLSVFMEAGGPSKELICPVRGEGIRWSESHVDHIPPDTFKNLVARFVASRGLDLAAVETVKDKKTGMLDVLADQRLSDDFDEFHREHARLRVVSALANLSNIKIEAHTLDSQASDS